MKTYQTLSVIFLFFLVSISFASNKKPKTITSSSTNVMGLVVDQSTNEKLAGVCIQIGDNQEKIYSNADGTFNIPVSTIDPTTLIIKCISYKDKKVVVDEKEWKKGKFSVKLEPVNP